MFPFTPHTTLRPLHVGRFLLLGDRAQKALYGNNCQKNKRFLKLYTLSVKIGRLFAMVESESVQQKRDIERIFGMSAAAPVTDSTFKELVLDSDVPVLVDFWAPWCGPCRMVAPVVDEIAEQYQGQVKVVKLNTDENPNTASQYGIRSIPTLMIFKGGQRVDMVVGAVPKTTLANTLEKYL
jgi:thioredoxin 1